MATHWHICLRVTDCKELAGYSPSAVVMSLCDVFTPAWKILLQKLLAKVYFFFPSLELDLDVNFCIQCKMVWCELFLLLFEMKKPFLSLII